VRYAAAAAAAAVDGDGRRSGYRRTRGDGPATNFTEIYRRNHCSPVASFRAFGFDRMSGLCAQLQDGTVLGSYNLLVNISHLF